MKKSTLKVSNYDTKVAGMNQSLFSFSASVVLRRCSDFISLGCPRMDKYLASGEFEICNRKCPILKRLISNVHVLIRSCSITSFE